jgi:hypothetical protein
LIPARHISTNIAILQYSSSARFIQEPYKLLNDVLLNRADLRQSLTKYVVDQRKAAAADAPGVAELEAERDELKTLIRTTLRSLKGAALADAEQELARMGARRNEIEARLAELQGNQQIDVRPVDRVVTENGRRAR